MEEFATPVVQLPIVNIAFIVMGLGVVGISIWFRPRLKSQLAAFGKFAGVISWAYVAGAFGLLAFALLRLL